MRSATGTVNPLGLWNERALRRADSERVDVLIITAVKDEYDAVLTVDAGALPGTQWDVRPGPMGLDVAFRDFEAADGGPLRVAVTRAVEMGGVATAVSAGSLAKDFRPKCLAMSGVCAGRRGKVELGDVIIADRVWTYDTGKVQVEVDEAGQRRERVLHDTSTYQLNPVWKQKAEAFLPPQGDWLETRPRTYASQMQWVLERLLAGEDPARHAERARLCAGYTEVLKRLWREGLLDDGTLRLSEAGRGVIQRQLLLHPDGLPEPLPFNVHVGAIATGSQVVQDPARFETLSASVRTVLGLEMEGSAIGAVAHQQQIPYMLVMKGVMDFADAEKNDHFKAFAARASAECLLAFVRAHLPSEKPSADGRVGAAGDVESFSELLDTGLSQPPASPSPAALLNARYRYVPFFEQGRTDLLQRLRDWCDGDAPVSARVFHGAGGMGKTRLFIEWCERLLEEGWRAGFLVRGADPARFEALVASEHPTLVVIDYAESRSKLDALLQLVARRRSAGGPGRLRLVLLARTIGEWFHELQAEDGLIKDLLADHPPEEVRSPSAPGAEREEVFRQAARCFAAQRGSEPPLRPPQSLEDPRFERILYVHMAALAAVEGQPFTAESLMGDVLDHEERFWLAHVQPVLKTEVERRLFKGRARRAVAALTLLGGAASRTEAEALLSRASDSRDAALLLLLQDLYPGGRSEGSACIGGLEPDLLGEAMVLRALQREGAESGRWLERVFQGAGERAVRTGFELLGRLTVEHAEQVGHWIQGLLEQDLEGRAAAALEAAKAVGLRTAYATLGMQLAAVLERKGTVELAVRLDQVGVPWETVSLREVGAWVVTTLVRNLPEEGGVGPSLVRSFLLLPLGHRQIELGQNEAAVESLQRAVSAFREHVSVLPESVLRTMAFGLGLLGLGLSNLGKREAALEATRECISLVRQLVKTQEKEVLPLLGTSLGNLGMQLGELDRWSEALKALREAEAIARRFVAAKAPAATPQLAYILVLLGVARGKQESREGALESTLEAVELFRMLTRERPDAFLPWLAGSLANLSGDLSSLGQRESALTFMQESVDIFQLLARTRPDVFREGLALSFNNLCVCQVMLGHRQDALASMRKAVDIYRDLVAARPDKFLPHLVDGLRNLCNLLSELGHQEEALKVARDGLELSRGLAETNPSLFRPALAMSLFGQGVALGRLNRWIAALQMFEESLGLLRELAEAQPQQYKPQLAQCLLNVATAQNDLGRRAEALHTVQKAVMLFRELFQVYPDSFSQNLARTLVARSRIQAALGLHPEALKSAQEGLDIIWPYFVRLPEAFRQETSLVMRQLIKCTVELGQEPSRTLREQLQRFGALPKP